jgi:hypothetical protein
MWEVLENKHFLDGVAKQGQHLFRAAGDKDSHCARNGVLGLACRRVNWKEERSHTPVMWFENLFSAGLEVGLPTEVRPQMFKFSLVEETLATVVRNLL